MILTVATEDLKPGMFVILPEGWFNHPFVRGQFLLRNAEEISRIREHGIGAVKIDTARSQAQLEVDQVAHSSEPPEPPESWMPEKDLSEKLRGVMRDPAMDSLNKAHALYHESLRLMHDFFNRPSVDRIPAFKQDLHTLVGAVLEDEATALSLLKVTSHDFYTYTHSVNVGVFSLLLARRLYPDATPGTLRELGAGFFLHDLGKIRVGPEIINKRGRLTDAEMRRMRVHPYQGWKMLRESGAMTEECALIVVQHHEREDGSGYPRRLRGDAIHEYARICCIADVYDALTAERSYKRSLGPFEALQVMRDEMLGHFHRELFEEFVHIMAGK